MNTQQKGQIAQLKVELRAVEKGFITSKPTVDARYDLIIDDKEKLIRAQIKYCNSCSKKVVGSFLISLRKWAGDKRTITRNYTKDEIDVLLVYFPILDCICCVPVEEFDDRPSITLRYNKPKNNTNIIRNIKDYLW